MTRTVTANITEFPLMDFAKDPIIPGVMLCIQDEPFSASGRWKTISLGEAEVLAADLTRIVAEAQSK